MPLISSYIWQVINLYSFRIKLGNVVADVQSNFSYVKKICEPYFSLESPACEIVLKQTITDSVKNDTVSALTNTNLTGNETSEWFLEVYELLHKLLPLLPEYSMLFMHGSAIRYKGKAYIFVAPSGTGKSTHSRLWKERFGDDVTVINDDKPFLAFRDGKVFVCGTPWRGKHNVGENLEVELAGICVLSRGEQNAICLMEPADAVKDIMQQSNLHSYKHNTLLALDLIDRLLAMVPVYKLSCTPTLDAVDVCCNGIIK